MRAAASATLVFVVLLASWHVSYAYTDFGILPLLGLALMIGYASFRLTVAIHGARRSVVVRPGSPWTPWLTGRLSASLIACGTIIVIIPVLAWTSLTVGPAEAACLLAIFAASGLLSQWFHTVFTAHLTPPFAEGWSVAAAVLIVGCCAVMVLFTLNEALFTHPAVELSGDFVPTFQSVMSHLPERRGWVSEILSVPAAVEAAKLWFTATYADYWPAVTAYCLQASFVAFAVAQAGALMSHVARWVMAEASA